MAFGLKEGRASLWRNEHRKSDKSPEYTGDGMLNGQKVRLLAWVKQTTRGRKYFSIVIVKDEKAQPKETNNNAAPQDADEPIKLRSEGDNIAF